MKVTRLYLHPIKALRPLSITKTQLDQQGFKHDRRFMLVKVEKDGSFKNVQTLYFPECTRLYQEIDGDDIVVTYHAPAEPLTDVTPEQGTALRVPLHPDVDGLPTIDIELMGSKATAYRMDEEFSSWFSSCLGYDTILVYIGDGKRPVLAHSPKQEQKKKGWYSSITSYISGQTDESDWLTFNEAAPLLIASEASLEDVSSRLPAGETMDMMRFRPNIVVDGSGQWDEDFWAELLIGGKHRLALTANCARCMSINIDYDTGRPAQGDAGAVLKKLMKDRRVDAGIKWSPIFGRYAFLMAQSADVAVGDEVTVTRRNSERSVWSWPKKA
ncbi:MOSC domain-containing protein [Xylariales sp. AK1849]|nr:MOSC domain-containing protein [Xylariales sp. AK1849]